MLEELKAIKETHIEAKQIIERATLQAERIKVEAEQKASEAYESAFNETLKQAEQEAIGLKEKEKDVTAQELKGVLFREEEQEKEIEELAKKNFDAAVEIVLNELYREN